jgi:hypothetical protein
VSGVGGCSRGATTARRARRRAPRHHGRRPDQPRVRNQDSAASGDAGNIAAAAAAAGAPLPAAAPASHAGGAASAAVSGFGAVGALQHLTALPFWGGASYADAAADAAAAGVGRPDPEPEPEPAPGPDEPAAEHKALFPLEWRDVAMLALTGVTLVLAAGGGIGGGARREPGRAS